MMIFDISQEVFNCQVYPGDPAPEKKLLSSMEKGGLYNLTAFSMCAHNGTHIDAPFHFLKDGKTVDAIGLEAVVGMAYVAEHQGMDLYCGAGAIGLLAAPGAKEVVGVEVVAAAVEDAREAAERNGVGNVSFLCADAAEAAAQFAAQGMRPEVLFVDPPRKGLDASVIDSVAAMGPSRVVYVSCDPATLARDLRRFADLGYAAEKAIAVDMFPRTRHVESVVKLARAGS